MLDKIIPGEERLLWWINSAHSPCMDSFMWLYTGYKIWLPLVLLLLVTLIYKKKRSEWMPALFGILAVFLCCSLLSLATKEWFARFRPTHFPGVMEQIRLLHGYTGGLYGFISGHSANSFGFALFTSLLFRNRLYTVVIFLWAAIMVYSRLYLGVHFLSDVAAGILGGMAFACLLYRLWVAVQKRSSTSSEFYRAIHPYSPRRIQIMTLLMVAYIVLFGLLSDMLILWLK